MWWKYLIALAIIGHGLGHATGVGAAVGAKMGFADKPWIFSQGIGYSSVLGKAWGVLWLGATILLVAAGVGLMLGTAWWLNLAIIGAAVSLLAIVPWWNTVVPGARAGAAFDVVLLVALLGPWSGRLVQFLH